MYIAINTESRFIILKIFIVTQSMWIEVFLINDIFH